MGREETGELESQIRGSRHAWDVRLISIDALVRLMNIRHEVDDPEIEARIRSLLVPREYTRLDEIIDLVFSTTQELREESPHSIEESDTSSDGDETPKAKPVSFNDACAERIAAHLAVDLAKESRITYSDADQDVVVNCAVSKEYPSQTGAGYWFALHPHQLEKLKNATRGYAAYGCGSPAQIALLPLDFIESQLEGMNQTHSDDRSSYWHVQIHRKGDRWLLQRRKGEDSPDISSYMLLGGSSQR